MESIWQIHALQYDPILMRNYYTFALFSEVSLSKHDKSAEVRNITDPCKVDSR